MKKKLLFIIAMLTFSTIFVTAQAAQSTKATNLKLLPGNNAKYYTEYISWSCEVDLSFENEMGDWIVELVNPAYYQKISVKLYSLTKRQGGMTLNGYSTTVTENYLQTLSSKSYNNKKSVSYSGSGNIKLSPGSYRIKLEATLDQRTGNPFTRIIESNDFTVVDKQTLDSEAAATLRPINERTNTPSPNQNRKAEIMINYRDEYGYLLASENKTYSTGAYSITPTRTFSGYRLISTSPVLVTVDSNGMPSRDTVTFEYRKIVNEVTTPPPYQPPVQSGNAYDIGIPNLNGNVYYQDDMNVHVLWVHYQLKATGMYYQGDSWDETGNLGDRTMREIGKFMQDNGYRNHDGHVDQTVINTLADYLGSRRMPVYVGGFYEKMNTIMTGGSAGSMQSIDENSNSTKIKWVQSCLSKLGYYRSSIDGKFGSGTISALKAFQREYGYEQRDYVSLGVARAMLEACYNQGCYLDDLP